MEKPTLRVLVALPMVADVFTDPVCCSLEFYYDELRGLGYRLVGPDPDDEIELAAYERLMRAPQRKRWLDAD
jgi:hypothetical protein